MSYQFARINLSKTSYTETCDWAYLTDPDADQLNSIYRTYCQYKRFDSVMPIFHSEYTSTSNDVIGYYHNKQLVAFSLIHRFDDENAECVQFAWDYSVPKLRLGIRSLENECAVYKQRGFKYLYLGGADEYKKKINGFEILGELNV